MSDSQQLLNKPSQSARQWAMFCHLSAFAGLIFPFGNLLGPLILWQVKKDADPFIDAQGKEALNFQITVAIAATVSMLLMLVVIGFALLMLVGIGAMVLTIIAGVKANDGLDYRYPFTWRVLK
ncbi:DUF4870 domain-containing protein [Pseudomonas syringae pv. actinidiae]|jgi:uncharacterized Tic20 family protein|uniref:DUF4870 domain-containing protein n=6 Tax=Pseudomonas syringae group TaxID=136849 RepID=A0A261WP01_9PSED|nr:MULTISPECIES: DUF4870 domain-containing protein [Pseudomonas syringae group]EPN23447.1 hypothetical protein A259_05546 [Pseudomonas syringae pv. actinidiae ICMP 19070]EPN57123.1 hypothetical protein A235_32897 [Pseudomonas syringae pv. actinidiae ICMP 19079]EPN85750.1 hypothetical protein A234_05327 [Pseudomonas syringae pv. actinidiae ICMP 19101]AKT28053.1 orotate phosphoribosyltransferase [Pseudomonas syringae pv. actinidiae ICMP 18884]AOE54622.1 orotate phosphoribosyltransferase [Pseudom